MLSCVCLTYHRPKKLEEAIESFLRQTYSGPKELIILNDNPRIKYKFDHPDVRIVNMGSRYENIGKKINASVELCHYPVRVGWPDDDIYLPNALKVYTNGINDADYYSFTGFWWLDKNGGMNWRDEIVHGLIIAKTEAIKKVGGYPEICCGEDKGLRKRLVGAGLKEHREKINRENGFFIERWGESRLTSYTIDKGWDEIGKIGEKLPQGDYELHPHWDRDYSVAVATP